MFGRLLLSILVLHWLYTQFLVIPRLGKQLEVYVASVIEHSKSEARSALEHISAARKYADLQQELAEVTFIIGSQTRNSSLPISTARKGCRGFSDPRGVGALYHQERNTRMCTSAATVSHGMWEYDDWELGVVQNGFHFKKPQNVSNGMWVPSSCYIRRLSVLSGLQELVRRKACSRVAFVGGSTSYHLYASVVNNVIPGSAVEAKVRTFAGTSFDFGMNVTFHFAANAGGPVIADLVEASLHQPPYVLILNSGLWDQRQHHPARILSIYIALLRETARLLQRFRGRVIWRLSSFTEWRLLDLRAVERLLVGDRTMLFNDAARAIMEDAGIEVFDSYRYALGRPDAIDDGLHPNEVIRLSIIESLLHVLTQTDPPGGE